jgi:hypothetical protein
MRLGKQPKPEDATPLPDEKVQETADYDSWYSALFSFVFHFLLFLIVSLLGSAVPSKPALPVTVSAVQVSDGPDRSDSGDLGDGPPGGDVAEVSTEPEKPNLPGTEAPAETIEALTDVPMETVPLDNAPTQQEIVDKRSEAQRQAARAQTAAQAARDRLNQTPGATRGGGGGSGGGTGSGSGGGGSRAARWVLRFNTSSPRDYLAQLGGLGADVAFPQRGDKYLFVSNLAGTLTKVTRTLGQESRVFWIDENPQAVSGVAEVLGIPVPPLMAAFLPPALEEKMVRLELAYKNAASEDEIIQTVFDCVKRGGSQEVIVTDQKLRGR